MRKLASIQKISNIAPIENADAIDSYQILGWNVVDRKGQYKIGDLVIYCEVDSWIPHVHAPFLSKGKEPREYEGIEGEKLRTIRLRGTLSQGLILPIDKLDPSVSIEEGRDVSEALNIIKWEPQIPANLRGNAKGLFPIHLVRKTDQERIQNCFEYIAKRDDTYEVTLKLDGTSCTIIKYQGELRVCSRNLELKIDDTNTDNTYVKIVKLIEPNLANIDNIAIQGEIIGPAIQKNKENLKDHQFFVFDITELNTHQILTPRKRRALTEALNLTHVPIIDEDKIKPVSIEEALRYAEGPSLNNPIREGLVWKSNTDPNFSFKTISNKFLLKFDE